MDSELLYFTSYKLQPYRQQLSCTYFPQCMPIMVIVRFCFALSGLRISSQPVGDIPTGNKWSKVDKVKRRPIDVDEHQVGNVKH